MNALNKILQKDPLKIADDDHPNRKDISEKEFFEAIKNLQSKFGTKKKKDRDKRSAFSKEVIDSLNSVEPGTTLS